MGDVTSLTRRLTETPADFLRADIDIAALVSDLLVAYGGGGLDPKAAHGYRSPSPTAAERNRRGCIAVAVWLLYADELVAAGDPAAVEAFIDTGLASIHQHVAASDLVHDPDRREELVRTTLNRFAIVPDGETAAQAADRLAALDSGEQARVLAAAREAERRAEEVRRAMHERAAAEAAAKGSRE